jgi:hypothetical protein
MKNLVFFEARNTYIQGLLRSQFIINIMLVFIKNKFKTFAMILKTRVKTINFFYKNYK